MLNVPSTRLEYFHILTHLLFTTIQWKMYHNFHFSMRKLRPCSVIPHLVKSARGQTIGLPEDEWKS